MSQERKDLYVIVRSDLSPGQQAVQAMHAYQRFHSKYPEIIQKWVEESNHISFLVVKNEAQLKSLESRITKAERKYAFFNEPDLELSLTGICLEPGDDSKHIVRKLSFALKDTVIPKEDSDINKTSCGHCGHGKHNLGHCNDESYNGYSCRCKF